MAPRSRKKKEKSKGKLVTRKEVKQMIDGNAELKRLVVVQFPTGLVLSNSGTIIDISTIPAGTGVNDRVGETVRGKDILFTIRTTSSVEGFIRSIIFVWKQNSADYAPAVSDIITSGDVIGLHKLEGSKNFHIIYDKVMHLASGIGLQQVRQARMSYKRKIQFNGTATSGTNKAYLLLIGSSSGSELVALFNTRVRYYDS